MVAPKRGRGRGGQAAKARAAAPVAEQPIPEALDAVDAAMEPEENNGQEMDTQQNEGDETLGEENDQHEGEAQESAETEDKTEEKKEEKVESGKLLIENLPPSFLFTYIEKLTELFSKHGEVVNVRRGPIIVTEQTTTPTLSAIVEFKNKESLEKALSENGTLVGGNRISAAVESRSDTAVLVGVPYEASTDYVRALFAVCGEIQQIQEFSKAKYKILRVTFLNVDSVPLALQLDRELRINGFLVTVSKYRDEEEQKAHAANVNKNKRQHPSANRNSQGGSPQHSRNNSYRGRGQPAAPNPPAPFNNRGNFRGGRGGRGFGARGGAFGRGGFAGGMPAQYMPPAAFMGRPQGFMNDGQRPNKRMRQ